MDLEGVLATVGRSIGGQAVWFNRVAGTRDVVDDMGPGIVRVEAKAKWRTGDGLRIRRGSKRYTHRLDGLQLQWLLDPGVDMKAAIQAFTRFFTAALIAHTK